MLIKIHNSYRKVVAICDLEVVGKKFEEKKFQLNVKKNFFMGKKVSEKELINITKSLSAEDATFKIVGKKSVQAALTAGIISKENIKKIQGIPFALVLL